MREIAAAGTPAGALMVDLSQKAAPRFAESARASPTDDGLPTLDALMDQCANGSEEAFAKLYRRAAPRVRGFLLRLCGSPPLADDLTQEAFLRVYLARGNFEKGAAALPWIFAIARNAHIDYQRHSRVRRTVRGDAGTFAQAVDLEAHPETRGDEVLAGREMLGIVRATLATMPVLLREAFVLLRFEGLSVHDAAQVLGASDGAVKIRAFRAYELLRAALDVPPSREGR
jgi:RNA polymerase sigma-70 factor (ECF subfamily)